MKSSVLRPLLFFFLILILSFFNFGTLYGAENESSETKALNSNSETNVNSAQADRAMLEMLGYMTVYRDGLKELGFVPEDAEYIARGLIRALGDSAIDPSMQEKMPEFQAFIDERIKLAESKREAAQELESVTNIAAGKKFLEGLKLDPSIEMTASGLHYKILEPGNTKLPKLKDTVRVHYKGTRIDGTEFDSSYKRGEPADFPLKGVVRGFSEGLMRIGEGGKIILFIPSDLAYGNNPRPGGVIQPGDTLIFECELIQVNP